MPYYLSNILRSSSIDVLWFGIGFGSFISSFATFPGGGVGLVGEIEIKAEASVWA